MAQFDHVIVGGGIIGASVAYHLAQESAGLILLVERNTLASAASSRAAELLLQVSTNTTKTLLARLTRETIDILTGELGDIVGFHKVGSLRLAASDARIVELDGMAAEAARHDIPFEWLDPQAAGTWSLGWIYLRFTRSVSCRPMAMSTRIC